MRELTLEFPDAEAWRTWLAENHEQDLVVWLVIYKVSARNGSLTYRQALEEALCYGWIDSRTRRVDDKKHVIRFTPRRKDAIWSVTNLNKVKALIAEGRMLPPGYAKLPPDLDEALRPAKERDEEAIQPPPDMLQAMAEAGVVERYEAMVPSHRRAFSIWVNTAKAPATRTKRLQEVITALKEGRLLESMVRWKPP